MSEKKLFLLDAYALIYRAHFAFVKTPRINSKGINTSVPFGFTNTLLEVLFKQKPTHIGIAFDTSAPTFRDEIFTEYKANRQETPEDIRSGVPLVKEIIRGFNIPILELDGYEADDVIGTISKKAAAQGFEVYMMTPDKDYGQLVDKNVFLYKPAFLGNAVDIMGEKEICERWDIANVSQVIEILGLQGDSVDNIPGIPGFGPKTAAELIKKYGNIENIIANAHELKGKKKELVEQYGEQALLSKKLATIFTEVPVEFNEEDLVYTGPDKEKLKPIFDHLEFKTLAARVFTDGNAPAAIKAPETSQLSMFGGGEANASDQSTNTGSQSFDASKVTYKALTREDECQNLADKLSKQKEFSLELSKEADEKFLLVFSMQTGEVNYIQFTKADTSLLNIFAEVLANKAVGKIGYNIKATLLALKEFGLAVEGKLFDPMIAHYLIEPEIGHDLSLLSGQHLQYQLLEESHNFTERISERVDISLQLKQKLQRELEKRGHARLMSDVEMPLLSVLADMEFEGVKVDTAVLAKMSEELRAASEVVQSEIFKLAGTEFNIGSPKQLGEILFDKMKLVDKAKKTKTGQYATGEEVLATLADEHPIAKKILDYREYEKLRSTYVDALPKLISARDGRIHTDYRQAVAATGRLSSNNPNLQNIPIRTEKGRAIRKAFVARDENFLFMSADYSQIELRIAASFAKDETMIEAFKNKRDIHATTAAKVFGVPLEQVTPDMRRKAKEVNFGILYGSTAFGLSQNLGISRTEAAEIIESYFKEFPGIKRYMDQSINTAREKEYVETILGRRRYLRDINSRNVTTRGFAERNAINAPIQGSAADIIKIAMVNIQQWMKKEQVRSRMIMQVHDELVFDLHKEEKDHVKENVVRLMKHAIQLEVPMEVEAGVGLNWLEAH
ncbi:DNA polymerase I [Chryseotalea sanaruensis]|uniref:DNA polymerase I n=1 Tax=Chryseotalea sanaruensis TaxID=2482724 RepID=A0A401U8T3_9BACT|nr:DNA polymerase I [Chryseotalea sanaruensis]GCC51296.1 DNA polymerase I [Chryseotalea sanaruensis]